MKSYLRKLATLKGIIILIVFALIVVGSFYYFHGSNNLTSLVVEKGEIIQTVNTTGQIKGSSEVSLSFDESGRVSQVLAETGDYVSAGQTIATLESGEARANLLAAEANLAYEQAKLSDAGVSLSDSRQNLIDKMNDSYTKADDTVHNYIDRFYTNPDGYSPKFGIVFNGVHFDTSDYKESYNLYEQRLLVGKKISTWPKNFDKLDDSQLSTAVLDVKQRLLVVKKLADDVSSVVNSWEIYDYDYQTVNDFRETVSSARTNINTTINNLTLAEQQYNTAKLAASSNNSNNKLSAQEAQIKQAEAQVVMNRAILAKYSIVAPISGTVTKQDAKVGEAVTASTPLVDIISSDHLEIEAKIAEIDIGKIKIGNPVAITIDAFPGEKFSGKVFDIDPAETIVDGIVNYKIKVSIFERDPRLKSGLTSNLSIETSKKVDVLTLPQYAIISNDRGNFVKKQSASSTVEVSVKTGLLGQDGKIEIVSGLNLGDQVLKP